jgi:hypothetical protein
MASSIAVAVEEEENIFPQVAHGGVPEKQAELAVEVLAALTRMARMELQVVAAEAVELVSITRPTVMVAPAALELSSFHYHNTKETI